MLAVLVVAIIGVGVGVGAWFRPMPDTDPPSAPPAPTYTDQQIADAKTDVCSAYATVRQAISVNSNKPNPMGDDFAAKS